MLEFFGRRLRYIQEVKRDERGFTLIELLVVVIIIGILAAIAIPVFLDQRAKANEAAAKAQLRSAATAQSAYFTQNGNFTATKGDLAGFGFPSSGSPTVNIVTPASGTADTFCMQAGGFKVSSVDNAPASGNC